jgi:short-subunit dehydrogenase
MGYIMGIRQIAIITGASSGLGAGFARSLDKVGLSEFWLVARRREKLAELAESLDTYCRCLSLDLTSKTSLDELDDLLKEESKADDFHIAYLINASGFGCIGLSRECPREKLQRMVDLNCRAALALTEMCIPYMAGGSHILQIASCSAFQPIPNLAVYAASKAFLLSYSRALSVELKDLGITVTAVCPFWIRDTEFVTKARETDKHGAYFDMPGATTVERVVQKSLLAARRGKVVCTPDLVSSLHRIVASLLPHVLLARICKMNEF